MTTYTTLADLIDREIRPALDGVEETFDLDGFVKDLRGAGHIRYEVEEGHADGRYVLDIDEATFWKLVQKWDTKAFALAQAVEANFDLYQRIHDARVDRRDAFQAAIKAGATAYLIAQATGLSQTTVGKIIAEQTPIGDS